MGVEATYNHNLGDWFSSFSSGFCQIFLHDLKELRLVVTCVRRQWAQNPRGGCFQLTGELFTYTVLTGMLLIFPDIVCSFV